MFHGTFVGLQGQQLKVSAFVAKGGEQTLNGGRIGEELGEIGGSAITVPSKKALPNKKLKI